MNVIRIDEKPVSLNGAYTIGHVRSNSDQFDTGSSSGSSSNPLNNDEIVQKLKGDDDGGENHRPHRLFQTKELREFKKRVGFRAENQVDDGLPLPHPVILHVKFVFEQKIASGPIGKYNEAALESDDPADRVIPHPDVDGPVKGVTDAVEGVIVQNDRQIVDYHLYSRYDPDDPHIVIGYEKYCEQTIPGDLQNA